MNEIHRPAVEKWLDSRDVSLVTRRNTWARGADSFIAMIYERLILMRDLMEEMGAREQHRRTLPKPVPKCLPQALIQFVH